LKFNISALVQDRENLKCVIRFYKLNILQKTLKLEKVKILTPIQTTVTLYDEVSQKLVACQNLSGDVSFHLHKISCRKDIH
jgi:hypothetical protein